MLITSNQQKVTSLKQRLLVTKPTYEKMQYFSIKHWVKGVFCTFPESYLLLVQVPNATHVKKKLLTSLVSLTVFLATVTFRLRLSVCPFFVQSLRCSLAYYT